MVMFVPFTESICKLDNAQRLGIASSVIRGFHESTRCVNVFLSATRFIILIAGQHAMFLTTTAANGVRFITDMSVF